MFPLAFANILILMVASVLGNPESQPPPEAPESAPQQPHAPVHPDPDVDRMLTELETADRGMRDLTAQITYDRIDATLGDRQYRFGELLFRDRTPEGQENRAGSRSFVVRFHTYADLDVVRDLNESWAFDGRWLIERNDDDRTFRKREITRAGQEVDPLRLGEGPLPIPIGQRKSDILARYEVELVDPLDSLQAPEDDMQDDLYESYREAIAGTSAVQLKLTPRTHEDGEFDSIRLWYWRSAEHPDRWLPLLARAGRVNARGREVDTAFVLMGGVKVNTGLDDAQMTVPEPREGFAVQVDRLPVEEK